MMNFHMNEQKKTYKAHRIYIHNELKVRWEHEIIYYGKSDSFYVAFILVQATKNIYSLCAKDAKSYIKYTQHRAYKGILVFCQ